MAYKNKAVVPYYNCDVTGKIKVSAALLEMQQAGTNHLEFLEISYEKLYAEGMVFLLSKTVIEIESLPHANQEIIISTAPAKSVGARFVREAIISDTDENLLASIITFWVLVNPETRRVLRPSSFPYDLPIEDSILDNRLKDEKFPSLEGLETFVQADILVSYSVIDNNGHVNNSSYVDMICDLIPYDELINCGVDKLAIAYQNEAKFGDTIRIEGFRLSEKQFNFVGTKENGNCFEAQIILK